MKYIMHIRYNINILINTTEHLAWTRHIYYFNLYRIPSWEMSTTVTILQMKKLRLSGQVLT